MEVILKNIKTICVIGLTNNPQRPAYSVAGYMQQRGFKIIPINPTGEEVLGEKGYKSIKEVPKEIKIELANFFIRPDKILPLIKEALDRGVPILWLQEGIINEEAVQLAKEKGAIIIMDRCIKKEFWAQDLSSKTEEGSLE